MEKARKIAFLLLLLCGGISAIWGISLGWTLSRGPQDFQAIYYGSRTLLLHHNPYRVPDVEQTYHADDRVAQQVTARQYNNMTLYVNTPGTLLFVAPFALLPLAAGQVLWMVLNIGSFGLAAYLIWEFASAIDSVVAGWLVCFILLNCQIVFGGGNTAALVIGLCAIGTWSFLQDRFVIAGLICMAISLIVKPHDSGLVWLYFLLASETLRKRALQSAGIAAALSLVAVWWIWSVAPTWLHDWQSNLAVISAPGGINDPRPSAISMASANNVISMQAVVSVFNDDPRFYSLVTYLVCGALLSFWIFMTIRTKTSRDRSWIAIAAIVPLTLLMTYHRVHDAKLLLLTIPACVLLWTAGRWTAWIAVLLTSASIIANADIPLAILGALTSKLHLSVSTIADQILTVLFARPSEELLFAMAVFYLWVYVSVSSRTVGELAA